MPETPRQEIAVLVVDDHALFRESVARLLTAEPGFHVVGDCESVEQGLEILRKTRVDIVLLDFDLGQHDGGEFMAAANRQGFTGKVLVVTAGVEKDQAAQLIRSGISGIFMKHHSASLLIEGIRDVLAGKVWFERELLQEAVGDHAVRQESAAKRFTQRERQILSYVFDGLANKEIAERIGMSESSVKASLQQLFSKTGVRTRSQLVRIALEQYKEQL
jgi:two-component system, NarL family, nitrate/nitrite response regulator NarL